MNTLTSLYTPHVLNVMNINIVVLSLSIMNVLPQYNIVVYHYQLQVVVMDIGDHLEIKWRFTELTQDLEKKDACKILSKNSYYFVTL